MKSCDERTFSRATSSASLDKVALGIMSASGAQQHHVMSISEACEFIRMIQASIDDAVSFSEKWSRKST